MFEKIYYSHNKNFWAVLPNWSNHVLKRTGKRDWLGVFVRLRDGTGVKVLMNLLLAPKEETLGPVRLTWSRKGRGNGETSKLSAVKYPKMELDSLLHLFTRLKFERKQEGDVCLLGNRSVH